MKLGTVTYNNTPIKVYNNNKAFPPCSSGQPSQEMSEEYDDGEYLQYNSYNDEEDDFDYTFHHQTNSQNSNLSLPTNLYNHQPFKGVPPPQQVTQSAKKTRPNHLNNNSYVAIVEQQH